MIIDAIFGLFAQALALVHDQLPDVPSFDTSEHTGPVGSLFQWAGWANWWVPVDHAVILLGLLLTAWAVMYALDFANWALTKLHLLGGNSS